MRRIEEEVQEYVNLRLAPVLDKRKTIDKETEQLNKRVDLPKSLGEIEIRIDNRRCQILFPTPDDVLAFIERQDHEPELCAGQLLEVDNSNLSRVNCAIVESVKESCRNYKFYIYKNSLYYFDRSDLHTEDEQRLLVKERYFKELKRFRRLRKEIRLYEKLGSKEVESREPIPEEVRFAVWRRDKGRCVKCGTNKDLEFDHIIPVSKGGSNTERNIQLLCQKCNREKSDKI
ncbi:MAG: HNH endonuclease [Deltaproteobacteria bacterium]|nr:HNH endonuclease [Deltaproteobacteria bacterium]